MHDKNGKLIRVGDIVMLACVVLSTHSADGYCNTDLRTAIPMPPYTPDDAGAFQHITVNARQTELPSVAPVLDLSKSIQDLDNRLASIESKLGALDEALEEPLQALKAALVDMNQEPATVSPPINPAEQPQLHQTANRSLNERTEPAPANVVPIHQRAAKDYPA
jgi:hypothetical protein